MGQLVEGTIPQIFNGVSRQPHSVRYPGQVEEAVNVVFSVETGGFTKRLGTRIKLKLSGFSPGAARRLHIINRDRAERYRVVLSSGSLRVFDQDYVEKTVHADAANAAWLVGDPSDFSLLSALDYTFIVKKTDVVAMSSTVGPAAPAMAVVYVAASPDVGTAVLYKVDINGVNKASYSASTTSDTATIASNIQSQLSTNLGAGWTVTLSGSYVFIKNNANTPFTLSTNSPRGDTGLASYHDTVDSASAAPARALNGMMLNVKGTFGEGYWIKFAASNGTSGEGFWQETVTPGTHIAFDPATMPRALIRETDGSFTLQMLTWNDKTSGGDDDVPAPEFVGQTIQDLVFVRNRLGFVAGETVYFSAAGDYFRFWPKSATALNDDDPFGLTNTTNQVSKFYFATPFRRSTFIMGDTAQFEVGGTLLTAAQASIDLATSYPASTVCRPVPLGDELYFPAEVGKVASIMSYTFDESSVSETANDVTKHIEGYIPTPVVELAGDPIRGFLAVLTDADRSTLFTHKFYYQGQDRVQSAWSKNTFSGATILSSAMSDGVMILLAEWMGYVWLWELPNVEDEYEDYDWVPRIDQHQFLTGSYNATSNLTTWALGYNANDPVAITSNLFPDGKRMLSLALTKGINTVSAVGDWTAAPMMIGENFDAYVELSKQFLRNQDNTSIISGRLQLRTMTLRYTDTGYFTVDVTPEGRDTKRWVFSGRVLGSALDRIQRFPILGGNFRFGVRSNAETATIRIGSDKFTPFTIVSAVWTGFFNEISRQG